MFRVPGVRLQIALVLVLFLGSLSALLYSGLTVLRLPRREQEVREQLRAASGRMAEGAADFTARLPHHPRSLPEGVNQELRDLSRHILLDYPGVEGGFYFVAADRFGGFAYPTGPDGPDPHPPRNDPPPRETDLIRAQAQQSVRLAADEFTVSVQDVGPSRVAILTEPVGQRRPAPLITWVLFRLTSPEQLEERLRTFAISSVLSLGGIMLALGLTWNLARSVSRQRREQDHLRDELRRAEHLAALGKLLAGVAHEVRNPLAGIRSTVQLWQRLPETARDRALMDAVIAAVDRLNALVSRLLLFSRADSAERRSVDVNEVLRESLDLVTAQAADQRVALERDLAPDLPLVSGSANALRQLTLNLLTNALQAMPGGGRMNYPEYRRLGLPISSAPVESVIKQINRRVKGSEKFWLEQGAEAVLQVRAAYLSEDGRAERYWQRPRPYRRAVGSGRLHRSAAQ
ncbi:MAG: histidine kinase [Planctomycetes bacterium]|nr:histidine kinase [Planctomycetota bacterium]